MTNVMNRRRALAGLGALAALALLPGCKEAVEAAANSCPEDPAESGGITWNPDIGRPVFWGVQDLTAAVHGTPRDMRVYYPSYDGATANAPMLKLCLTGWPLVLLLHGQPPAGVPLTGYHAKWERFAAVLARCGYVVAVPSHPALLSQNGEDPALTDAANYLAWVRNQWDHRRWVSHQADSTAVVGHSYGGLLGARVMAANPAFGAFVSLGAPYAEINDRMAVLTSIGRPSFFAWATEGNSLGQIFEDLDGPTHIWDNLPQPRYAAVYEGEHFDYLRPQDVGSDLRGPCPLVGGAMADLVALFLATHVPVPLGRTRVPVELTPPKVELTPQQEFFAGAHLQGVAQFQATPGCRLDLRWNVDGKQGSRTIKAN
ncbi:alpha/beta hydrolase [Catellatospora tritici]|uniref:alpha/beta hydrolase n=1 Tax=Catellatospora tritici TaxID=2851566 RepID=UPI001C2DC4AA|nr:alpha/beta hydrolase [Catellatospora tritici]MBV1855912.1 alpha/beta hydrolase [Catellatospora tritici]